MKEIESIYDNIRTSCLKISEKISDMNPFMNSKIVSNNISGDEVKTLDLITNNIMIKELSKNKNIKYLISEENEDIINIHKDGKYLVAFDPLDGSSNIDSNITIGTIFCIYKLDNNSLDKIILGKSIVSAGYCLYGGSTQLILADKNNGVNLYVMNKTQNSNKFKYISELKMPEKGKIYAINESNKYRWNNRNYIKLVKEFIDLKYTQRWVGSLVADAHRTIIKGGFFSYPGDEKSPLGSLRLLYEAIPFCFIIENSGGNSYLNDNLKDWKKIVFPKNIHVKIPVTFASNYENNFIIANLK
uniref:fructose-bisphosphatase n=1 Tax=viral metagenome TaxID=1070528 RepID=A0A6C0M126_9ZZZZ